MFLFMVSEENLLIKKAEAGLPHSKECCGIRDCITKSIHDF